MTRGGPLRTGKPCSRAGSRAAFTLIELLGVIVVMGLIATIVTVNWQSAFPRSQLNSTVRALAATLQATRSDAIARTAEFRIEYDIDENRYRVVTPFQFGGGFAVTEEDRVALGWIDLPSTVRFQSVFVDGEEYDAGLVIVVFDPLGAASDHIVVLAQDMFENYYTIEVQALTGLISFYEGVHVRPEARPADFE